MSQYFFLFLCLFIIKLSFILCVDISIRNETESYTCELPKTEVAIDSDTLQNDSIVYNDSKDQYFFTNVSDPEQIRMCSCLLKPCIPTCCPFGMMNFSKCFEVNYTTEIPIYDNTTLLDGYKIDTEHVELNCKKYRLSEFYLQANGSILEGDELTVIRRDEYCVDFVESEDEVNKYRLQALVCFPEQKHDEEHALKIKILSRSMLVSVLFLVITLVVYCILPELHNLHGYIMITYVSCLTVFFTFLSTIQMTTAAQLLNDDACVIMAFAVYFSTMASFFWMNIMCFDIWWMFSGQRSWQAAGQSSIKKRYMFYSIYAWLMPTLLTCLLAYMQFKKSMWINNIYPGFGVRSCWFHDGTSQIVYLYVPIGILLVCNLVLFSATTYQIFSMTRATKMLQENESKKKMLKKERRRFFLYMKLFTVMGLNWILELLSFFIAKNHKVWIISDLFNTLIGVIIFIILVLKKKILKLLIRRYVPCIDKKVIKHTETSTTLPSLDNSVEMSQANLEFTQKFFN